MAMVAAPASSKTERLWKEYLTDPSRWLDNRNSKTHPRSPDFKHKLTKESLWIDGWYNPSWVEDLLEKMETSNKLLRSPKAPQLPDYCLWDMLSLEDALASLERSPYPPSIENLTCIFSKCRKEKNAAYVLRLHAYMLKSGLEAESIGNSLVPMLVEVGRICDAQQVFDRLVDRNEHSWTSLITGYIECGDLQHAFILYQKMLEGSVYPSGYTYVALLQACAGLQDTESGQEIHAQITRNGLLETNVFVGNALVDMYAKCGLLAKAQEVFDKLPVRDTVSWTALIAGYAEHGCSQEALNCFDQMELDGISPNAVTYIRTLKACGSIGAIEKGIEIHAAIATGGLLEINPFVSSTLVDMYAKCGLVGKAREVFDKLGVRDAVSWNTLIAGNAEHGLGQDALNCFEQMQLEGISPNAVTFVCTLKACGSIGAINKGIAIHNEIVTKGLLERDPVVGSTLVDMYAKCGFLVKAQEVFNKLAVRDAVSWTALIAGYAEHGLGDQALDSFQQMQLEGVSPNVVTFVCSLKACGIIGAIDKGMEIHAKIATKASLERDSVVGSTLVDMYAKYGFLVKAQEVFDRLAVRDAVSWTALIAGYAERELGEEALDCFEQMQLEGVSPNVVTFICSLKACGSIGAIEKGIELHAKVAEKGLLKENPCIGNTLVNMYGKCGLIAKAQEVFHKLPVQDAISWNALVAGYAHLGESENVFLMLDRMKAGDIKPDEVTFLSILTVCSHTGLVDKGQTFFEAMRKYYGITPTIEHHTCIVDLLGRAGQLDKAVVMIKKMPFNPNLVLWHTVLAACQKWGNVELGKWAFEHAVQVDKNDATAYVLMSNIYADTHMQEDAKKIEVMRLKGQACKKQRQLVE